MHPTGSRATAGRTRIALGPPPAEELRKLDSDPIRMYLSQMANIPLLSREEEISLAKKIEVSRKRFRRTVLSCDFAMQQTVETLDTRPSRRAAFDRTIKVSLTERLTKEQILARMPHNLRTLQHLLRAEPPRLCAADPPVDTRRGTSRSCGGSLSADAASACNWSRSSACGRDASSR